MGVEIDISNHDALVDEVIGITIQGLSKNQPITVHATILEKDLQFGSCGCFYADGDGIVDVAKQASQAGTYTGISPMGLFWSMKSAPGERFGTRLTKNNASKPLNVTVRVCDGHVSFEDLYTDKPKELADLQFRRWYMAKDVRKFKVKSGRVRGSLFLPPGPGPFTGIIDMFGIVGSIVEFRAALLASRGGYAVLALPYFFYDDLPKYMNELHLEYFLEAIQWLSDRPDVISDNIGILGNSKGGEIGLHAAYYSPKVKAVVSINGAAFFTGIPINYQGRLIGEGNMVEENYIVTDEGNIYKDCLKCEKENYIPIWEKDVKVLLITGGDDQALNPYHLIDLHGSYPAHKRHNCTVHYYPGAGHLLEPPYAPMCRSTYRTIRGFQGYEDMEDTILWGGSTVQHAFAQEDAWRKILQHFRRHLSPNKVVDSKL